MITFKTGDHTYQVPRIDSSTHAMEVIEYEHHEIHAGSNFFYADSVALNAAETQDYMVITPDSSQWAHMLFSLSGSAITQVLVYEGSDKVAGDIQSVFNSNRNSITLPSVKIHKGTSGGSTDGTLIWQRKSGSSSGQSRVGMETTHGGEIILRKGTKYIFRIVSGTNANLTNALFQWYEHTDKAA